MPTRRRDFLAAVSAGGLAGSAGCLGLGIFGPSLPDCSGDGVADLPAPTRGHGAAPVRVAVYSDFDCPHCATFAFDVAPRIDHHVARGNVAYVHRDFPVPVSGRSFPAANAARAVQDAAGDAAFFTYADRLFANQDDLGTDALVGYAEDLAVAGATVRAAVQDARYCQVVTDDRSTGSDRGVEGTPTAFVDGEKYAAPGADEFERAVESALE